MMMHDRRDVEDGRLHEGSATLSARVEHERVLRDDAVDAVGDHEGVEVDALDDVGHDEQLGAAVHRSRCRDADGDDYGARRGLCRWPPSFDSWGDTRSGGRIA